MLWLAIRSRGYPSAGKPDLSAGKLAPTAYFSMGTAHPTNLFPVPPGRHGLARALQCLGLQLGLVATQRRQAGAYRDWWATAATSDDWKPVATG